MTPMDLTSTPFLSYRDINTDGIDLYEDAWGFITQFSDVTGLLQQIRPVPDERLISRTIQKTRNIH
jgi:hypothetical protein